MILFILIFYLKIYFDKDSLVKDKILHSPNDRMKANSEYFDN
ncbi:hypothetical protein M23134_00401 [Microscilla marina ATCC 23134]|uniref:Uncharacterized protein n=1 Tax=Microscilla marina ATCC 23134 TaxID=313606 RepID=A1ZIY1_MICM2|nr:hypothetical protein M23134_00401 [Microscilla marina ATCC 23134]